MVLIDPEYQNLKVGDFLQLMSRRPIPFYLLTLFTSNITLFPYKAQNIISDVEIPIARILTSTKHYLMFALARNRQYILYTLIQNGIQKFVLVIKITSNRQQFDTGKIRPK